MQWLLCSSSNTCRHRAGLSSAISITLHSICQIPLLLISTLPWRVPWPWLFIVSLSLWMIIRVMTGWCFAPPFHAHTCAQTHKHTQSAVKQATRYCLFGANINFLFLQICRQDCVSCTVGVGPVALFLSLLTSLTLSLFYSRILADTVCFPSDRQPHADIHKLFGSSVW